MADQLRLDIQIAGAAASLAALDRLDRTVKGMPAAAQQAAAGQTSAAQQVGAAWQQAGTLTEAQARRVATTQQVEATRTAGVIQREATRTAEIQIREATRTANVIEREQARTAEAAERAANRMAAAASASSGLGGGVLGTAAQGALLGVGYQALGAVESALQGVGSAAIKTNADLEQARIGFITMLGGAQQADAFLKDMARFAATTPFTFPGLVKASQQILGVGLAASEVRPLLTAVGNAAAAMGSGQEGIDRITLALTQMQSKTRVTGEEVRQLTEARIPALQILAKELGVSTEQVADMMEKGAIKAEVFFKAFKAAYGEGSQFGHLMADSARTFNGAITTIVDNSQMAIAQGFKPLFEVIRDVTVAIADLSQSPALATWASNAEQASARVAQSLRNVSTGVEVTASAVTGLPGNVGQAAVNAAGVAVDVPLAVTGVASLVGWAAPAAGITNPLPKFPDLLRKLAQGPIGTLPGGQLAVQVPVALQFLDQAGAQERQREARTVGEDFAKNVAAAILATSPTVQDAWGRVGAQLQEEFLGRGFSPTEAAAGVEAWSNVVKAEMERQRPGFIQAATGLAEALQTGLTGVAAQAFAVTAGAALKAQGNDLGKAIADAIQQGMRANFSPSAIDALVAEVLSQANAAKALQEVMGTLTVAERAHYEVLLQTQSAMQVLNGMYEQGLITEEQLTNARERGSVGIEKERVALLTLAEAHKQVADAAIQAQNAITLALAKGEGGFIQEAQARAAASALQQLTSALAPATQGWAAYVTAIGQAGAAVEQFGPQLAAQNLAAQEAAKSLQNLTAHLDPATKAWAAYVTATGQAEGALRAYGSELQGRTIQATAAASAATREYGERIKHLTEDQQDYFNAVRQVLGVEEALAQMRQRVSTASRGGFGGVDFGAPTGLGNAPAPTFTLAQLMGSLVGAGGGAMVNTPAATPPAAFIEQVRQAFAPAIAQGLATAREAEGAAFAEWERLAEGVRQSWLGGAGGAAQSLMQQVQSKYQEAGAAAQQFGQTLSNSAGGVAAYVAEQAALQSRVRELAGAMREVTVGTGLATHSIIVFGLEAERVAQEWRAAAARAAALMQGELLGAFGNIQRGLTYTQIYGGTGTTGGTTAGGRTGTTTGGGFIPGNYYGLPVVSPPTTGTLRGYAGGGWITEPTLLTSVRTRQTYGLMAEQGPERISGGGDTQIHLHVGVVEGLTGPVGPAEQRAKVRQLLRDAFLPEMRALGVRV